MFFYLRFFHDDARFWSSASQIASRVDVYEVSCTLPESTAPAVHLGPLIHLHASIHVFGVTGCPAFMAYVE